LLVHALKKVYGPYLCGKKEAMSLIEMKVPTIGESITEVTLSQWLKKDGDYVQADEPICEFESDKATLEFPAEAAGRLTHVAAEGDDLAIGALVARSRLNNRFCVPVSFSELDSQCEHVRNGNISNIGLNGRYRSLNLNAYAQHGTVEFRLHHGTLNGSKVKAWAEFVSALARYSSAGNLLSSHDGWYNPTEPENKVKELLLILAHAGTLSGDTADYLIGRAEELAR